MKHRKSSRGKTRCLNHFLKNMFEEDLMIFSRISPKAAQMMTHRDITHCTRYVRRSPKHSQNYQKFLKKFLALL